MGFLELDIKNGSIDGIFDGSTNEFYTGATGERIYNDNDGNGNYWLVYLAWKSVSHRRFYLVTDEIVIGKHYIETDSGSVSNADVKRAVKLIPNLLDKPEQTMEQLREEIAALRAKNVALQTICDRDARIDVTTAAFRDLVVDDPS